MSHKPRRQSPEWQWEQALIDAYADYRWHEVLDQLYEEFQRWKTGERDHLEIDEAIHKAHKECHQVYSFFCTRRKMLLEYIQYDREWFGAWLLGHPAPPGIIPPSSPDRLFSDGDRG